MSKAAVVVVVSSFEELESFYEKSPSLLSDIPSDKVTVLVGLNGLPSALSSQHCIVDIEFFPLPRSPVNLSTALNFLIRYAIDVLSAEYIFRYDPDDVWVPGRFATQISFFQSNKHVSVLGGGAKYINENRRTLFINGAELIHDDIGLWLAHSCPFIHPAVCFRASFFSEHNLWYDERIHKGQDFDLWRRAWLNGIRLHRSSDIVLEYSFSYDAWRRRFNFSVNWFHFLAGVHFIFSAGMYRALPRLVFAYFVRFNPLLKHRLFFKLYCYIKGKL